MRVRWAQFLDTLFIKCSKNLLFFTLCLSQKKYVDLPYCAKVSICIFHITFFHSSPFLENSSFYFGNFIINLFVLILTYSLFGSVFQSYSSAPSLTPDDDVFKHLSLAYANNHAKMSRGVACKSATPAFEQGTMTHLICPPPLPLFSL